MTYGNMAIVFKNQGHHERALELYTKALAITEKTLGPEHPDTLNTVFNMGNLARKSGDMATAKAFYSRASEGRAKSLGPAHPKAAKAQEAAAQCG